jgi:multimeric flavodoxin WrbA/putative sterol carrier protein
MMKILAIQGSPRPKVSNTEVLLQEFLKGARSQGAETETVYLKEKQIHYCVGCYTCWTKTPGVCVYKDDMPEIIEKIKECDIIVYATPLYGYNVTGLFKVFQDRTLPLLDPHIIKVDNVHRHPTRYATKRKMVLISNCGFPEIKHFDGLRKVFHTMEENGYVPLVGEILVPAGELLQQKALRNIVQKTIDAVFQAGVEVVKDGWVSKETQDIVQKPVIPVEEMVVMANLTWDRKIARVQKAQEKDTNTIDDMRLVLHGMAAMFNPQVKSGLKAVVQFEVTGKQEGNWFLAIENDKCTFNEGDHAQPTLTIKTPSEVWLSIVNKEQDGQQAFLEGKYQVEGDVSFITSLKELFPSN